MLRDVCKTGVPNNFAKFKGKYRSLFIEVVDLHLYYKKSPAQIFPLNFVMFLGTRFFIELLRETFLTHKVKYIKICQDIKRKTLK